MSKIALAPKNKSSKVTIEQLPKGIDLRQHYYRVIIGVNSYKSATGYLCYRKDKVYHYLVNLVNFNNSQSLEDKRFIFTENDFENLLDYLAEFDDGCLYTIAKIGKKEIDPYSLLPII